MEIYKTNITSAAEWKSVIGTMDGAQILLPNPQKKNNHSIDHIHEQVTVELTKGYYGLVSLADWSWMRFLNWIAITSSTMSGAVYMGTSVKLSNGKRVILLAHRLVAQGQLPDGKKVRSIIDHLDGSGLNNLPENLAVRSRLANSHNRTKPNKNNTTGELNVHREGNKFRVALKVDHKLFYWSGFPSIRAAVKFRDKTLPRLRSTLIKGAN